MNVSVQSRNGHATGSSAEHFRQGQRFLAWAEILTRTRGAQLMDAADQTGAGGVTDAAVRYIITRPCLAEGSLGLLKYLQPLFPQGGPLLLQDSRGERFPVTIDAGRGLITGLGELYRAHNMGVNDVLLITRSAEREYTVACVVKPHARPQTGPDRPAALFGEKAVTEKRVVIHATPHVREVRMERVTQEERGAPQGGNTQPVSLQDAQAPLNTARPGKAPALSPADLPPTAAPTKEAAPVTKAALGTPTGTAVPATAGAAPVTLPGTVPDREADALPANPDQPGTVQSRAVQLGIVQSRAVQSRVGPLSTLTARMQQRPALNPHPPIQFNFPARIGMDEANTGQPDVHQSHTAPTGAAPGGSAQHRSAQAGAAQVGTVQVGAAQVSSAQVKAAPVAPVQADSAQTAEDQLAALARLTGYGCEHLGHGVVRLRADLGSHGYSVLIATTPQALSTPAWNESCDYMALLTPESERPQGIPRFTHAALAALLEHARLAPLTPIDLRGYWNTGSFDQESVDSVAELVSAYLAQRGSFSHVLLTLAQQPAHSLVSLPRLAERLGSGVNLAELQSILETLSRPPFLALTPLPNGQYYLRSDVPGLLQEFGEYAEGMRRRLRPAPVSATGR